MRKRLLYSFLTPLLLTVACEDAGLQPVAEEEKETRLRIQVRNADTEDDIQLLVFDARAPKAIESYYPAVSGDAGIDIGTGNRIVACVLNGPDLSSVADFSSLLLWRYVPGESDNPFTRPLRFGYIQTAISPNTHTLSLDATLQAGRIVLRSVANRLNGRQTIESLHAYLANAAADNLLGSDYLPAAVSIHPAGNAASISEWTDVSLTTLPYGSTHTGPFLFSSCPTPPSWQPWLILCARISGRDWYYNIPLETITKGISQEVSVVLRTLGADSPCIANQPGSYDLFYALADWAVVPSSELI